MAILVALFAAMMIAVSAYGVVNPSGLIAYVRRVADGPIIFIAVGVRVAMAVLFWLAAPLARHPLVFQVLAVIALLAAFVILVVGKDRVLRLMEWVAGMPESLQRVWILFGVVFGGYLGWAIWPALNI